MNVKAIQCFINENIQNSFLLTDMKDCKEILNNIIILFDAFPVVQLKILLLVLK